MLNPKTDHKIACLTLSCKSSVWAFLDWSTKVFDVKFLNEDE